MDPVSIIVSFANCPREAEPLAALALPSDGRVSFVGNDFECVLPDTGCALQVRAAVVILAVALVTGNLRSVVTLPSLPPGVLPLVVPDILVLICLVAGPLPRFVVDLETVLFTLVTPFLIPALRDRGVLSFCFLFKREAESSSIFLRLAPPRGVFAFFVFNVGSFARCSFSLGRGPKTPRQLAEPHRHSWTFFWEYGLVFVSHTTPQAKDKETYSKL